MRRISFCDPETGKRLVFLTNNFVFPAETIAALYKKRWQVELFFKMNTTEEPPHQAFLRRTVGERRENANLDGGIQFMCSPPSLRGNWR